MKEYVENKLLIGFVIFIGLFSYFMTLRNNQIMMGNTNINSTIENK